MNQLQLTINHEPRDMRYAILDTQYEHLPSTSVEDPLQINPFYAKQTQFPQSPNERKLTNNNEL